MKYQIFNKKSKGFRLIIKWSEKNINFGHIEFKSDGSLIFISQFHSDKNTGSIITCGTALFKNNKFHTHIPEKAIQVQDGFHISLHPKEQKMHFKLHYAGEMLYERKINWFPVITQFNLLYFYTMPLDLCKISSKRATFITPVNKCYKDSLLLKIDVFSRTHFLCVESYDAVGYCPDYFVRVRLQLVNQRTPALIYWAEDEK